MTNFEKWRANLVPENLEDFFLGQCVEIVDSRRCWMCPFVRECYIDYDRNFLDCECKEAMDYWCDAKRFAEWANKEAKE